MHPGDSVSRVARQHGVSPAQIYKRRHLMQEGRASAIEAGEPVASVSEVAALKRRVAELEWVLGKEPM